MVVETFIQDQTDIGREPSMFDEMIVRGKIAKYFAQEKKFSPVQIPVEVEKCVQSLTLWCSRYCRNKEHSDQILDDTLKELLRE
jgi:hypothetical protein